MCWIWIDNCDSKFELGKHTPRYLSVRYNYAYATPVPEYRLYHSTFDHGKSQQKVDLRRENIDNASTFNRR